MTWPAVADGENIIRAIVKPRISRIPDFHAGWAMLCCRRGRISLRTPTGEAISAHQGGEVRRHRLRQAAGQRDPGDLKPRKLMTEIARPGKEHRMAKTAVARKNGAEIPHEKEMPSCWVKAEARHQRALQRNLRNCRPQNPGRGATGRRVHQPRGLAHLERLLRLRNSRAGGKLAPQRHYSRR
jgi:hypothetical protein